MENKNTNVILTILCILVLVLGVVLVSAPKGLDSNDVTKIVNNAISELSIPTAAEIAANVTVPEITIPEVENADNVLLNEFLEDKFADEYSEIEDAAIAVAEDEFEDKDYRVVERQLKDLIGDLTLDVDSMDVDVDETTAEVTKLGLGEDEDKCATVTFEFTVEYEYSDSEGFIDEAERLLEVEYTVCFTEGDFDDEEVEFVFK